MDIDTAGFEAWYRAEHPRVLAALSVVARDPDLAQEVAAEAFAPPSSGGTGCVAWIPPEAGRIASP